MFDLYNEKWKNPRRGSCIHDDIYLFIYDDIYIYLSLESSQRVLQVQHDLRIEKMSNFGQLIFVTILNNKKL